jgi:glutaredoxin-related protein
MYYKVYGITDCPSCLRAIADLMENDLQYVFINCDFSADYRDEIRDRLVWPTFPIVVVINGEESDIIGGHEQLKRHIEGI